MLRRLAAFAALPLVACSGPKKDPDVTGRWYGARADCCGVDSMRITLDLTRRGDSITGSGTVALSSSGATIVSGTQLDTLVILRLFQAEDPAQIFRGTARATSMSGTLEYKDHPSTARAFTFVRR